MTEFMRNSDAFSWAMEGDPRLRSTIVTVLVMDGTPDWDVVVERFNVVSRTLPTFRQHVVPSPGAAPPRWRFASDFDLDFHLRRVGPPEPPNLEGVLKMARIAHMEAFDPVRPMWHATLIDGLEGGQSALLCKMHHALTDGIGAIQIGMTLFDLEAKPQTPRPDPPEVPEPADDPLGELRDAYRFNAGRFSKVLSGVKAAPAVIRAGARQPVATAKSAAATAASVYRTVRPVSRTRSRLMTERGLIRQLFVLEVPKTQLLDAAHRCGGSLNDSFVAGVTGGLRRYHEKHSSPVDDLQVTMPISLRGESDPMGGNRITLMRFDLPVGMADPAQRIAEIRRRVDTVRDERSLPHTQAIAGGLNLVPRRLIGSTLCTVDFLASNVPGVPVPVFLGGAPVRHQYAFGPTIGSAVNVTLLTYVDTCELGVNIDTAAIPDHEVFRECLIDGFDEVLALAE